MNDEKKKHRVSKRSRVLLGAALLLLLPGPVSAQGHDGGGGHGGGGGGCGDVFGDLVHILRDDMSGQPILAQRWIELPKELPGFGWGYCPVAVYPNDGECEIPAGDVLCEIPFLPYTCDFDPDYLGRVVEVDYFGRLNGGRTKERNHRMHLDEVISSIKAADVLMQDPTGRLSIGYDCKARGRTPCEEWSTVDSPMESMALYTRLKKYGHLATDPYEVDVWAHGDPKQPPQFHPALGRGDWEKFHKSVAHLLPGDGIAADQCWDPDGAEQFTDTPPYNGFWDPEEPYMDINGNGEYDCCAPRPEPFTDVNGNGFWDPAEPFEDDNQNGVADAFAFLCAGREHLDNQDFMRAAAWLAAAANKTGRISRDLVQYANRILRVTLDTPHTQSTLDTLPALYRDCWTGPDPDPPPEEGEWVDPPYDDACIVLEVDPYTTPGYDDSPAAQELFVDFAGLDDYERDEETVEVILDTSETTWALFRGYPLLEWMELVNGDQPATSGIGGFVAAASDRLRSIEFMHNYAVPADLFCTYETVACERRRSPKMGGGVTTVRSTRQAIGGADSPPFEE